MSHGATGTCNMAFSGTSRSFSSINTSTDQKSTNGTLSTVNPWGSSSIWGSTNGMMTSGLTSSVPARDSAVSRDSAQTMEPEGKTGSGSLVDSSVSDDWPSRNAWGSQARNHTLGRSLQANGPFTDNSLQQQRSASNTNPAAMSFGQNQLPYATRAPAISLNSTALPATRQSFSNGFTTGMVRRSDEPPPIYTKFNRPNDPAVKTKPDSAVGGGWGDQNTPSPIDERRTQFPFHRTTSGPTSRDNSLPPSRHSDVEPPSFARVDYSRQAQGSSAHTPRAASISSQRNGYGTYVNGGDRLALQFGQMGMNGDSRPGTSYRPSPTPTGYNSYATLAMSRPSWQPVNGIAGRIQDMDDYDRQNMSLLGAEDATPRQHDYLSGYANHALAERYLQSNTFDFRPGHPYNGNGISQRSFEQQGVPRGSDLQNSAHGSLAVRRTPHVPDQQAYLDLRARPLMAVQLPVQSSYPAMYDQYAFQNAMQYTGVPSYMNMVPMGAPGIDASDGPREDPSGDGVQSALMYEFKSNTKTKRYELRDIYDHIAEFSGDQHGSRFIQTKLETANSDEKDRVFREIEPNAIPLMTDVFGNYVIQKFFEHGDMSHKKILAKKMQDQVYSLSKQMYGCRVVQKALDHVLVEQQQQLVAELKGHVLDCVKDQNGNHVIQKAIERCHPSTIAFIIEAFVGQVPSLSIHAYGCRVIQRCLEKCDLPQKSMIMAELLQSIHTMISDQFGNYVVQHVVAHDEGECRSHVLDIVMNNLEGYSKHKFASNVVEKCLEKSDERWRHEVVVRLVNNSQRRIEGESPIVLMIKDNFGNYVIQKLLDTLNAQDYFMFYDIVQPAIAHAKRTGCGKQILSIDKRMHKFDSLRNGSVSSATGGAIAHPRDARLPFSMHYSTPFASTYTSAANTPPPMIADTPQSSIVPSVNGDAVEGAMNKNRQGSDQSNDFTGTHR
ncbi:hypothetical protein DOTSEDRAFT_69859 [Dothistroma septosporum NZE10]|uniref:Pumilio homology domain family member 3 n=1 Tax=Dothistroma septosporum (strain NZE10 / CBS 128990) TaxID=675120 RepID=N1Q090_DOTSN|nr:hypothetical protein DOTSEDRAFT_69859 [Dothistroma septosporum NZE10]